MWIIINYFFHSAKLIAWYHRNLSAGQSWPLYKLVEVCYAQMGNFNYILILFWRGRRSCIFSDFCGNLFPGDVAVKILKVVDPTPEQFQAFRNEVAVLRWVGVSLLNSHIPGAAFDSQPSFGAFWPKILCVIGTKSRFPGKNKKHSHSSEYFCVLLTVFRPHWVKINKFCPHSHHHLNCSSSNCSRITFFPLNIHWSV